MRHLGQYKKEYLIFLDEISPYSFPMQFDIVYKFLTVLQPIKYFGFLFHQCISVLTRVKSN